MALKQQNFDPIASAKSQLSNANIGWSQKTRESALSRLTNIGLPSHRDEYWKYTNPAELLTENFNVSNEDILILSIIDLTELGGSSLIKEKGFSIKTIIDYE